MKISRGILCVLSLVVAYLFIALLIFVNVKAIVDDCKVLASEPEESETLQTVEEVAESTINDVVVVIDKESSWTIDFSEPEKVEIISEKPSTDALAIDLAPIEPVPESVPEEPELSDDVERMDLEWIKAHLDRYYTDEEIRQVTLIVQAEDGIAESQTIWSAHVWVILGRVNAPGFVRNGNSIIGVLSGANQFSTYTKYNLSQEVDPEIEWVVKDVFARKILEDMGAPEEMIGRTLPATHLFFKAGGGKYNIFYSYCWGDSYDPFDSPFNPYDN